jgi:arylformamidase
MEMDWDDAFDNSGYVAGSQLLPAKWSAEAEVFRAGLGDRAEVDIAYGAHPRARLDLFHPEGTPLGLVVFVHGGYWMRHERHFWSAFAGGALALGWAVAVPGYPLAPETRMTAITQHVGAAITCAAGKIAGPVRLTGHSAGGHLVSRMACAPGPLAADVLDRLEHVVSISGLHDLRPMLKAAGMNATLRMTPEEAAAESPVLHTPRAGLKVTAWVGADERPELVRQSHLLAQAWPGTIVTEDPGRDHFNVIDGLRSPFSPLTQTLLGASGSTPEKRRGNRYQRFHDTHKSSG